MAHFTAGAAHGNGIAVLRGGEIMGGDLAHTWVGTYQEEGPQLYARVRVVPWAASTTEKPTLDRALTMTLAGSCGQLYAMLSGHADESEVPVTVELHKAV